MKKVKVYIAGPYTKGDTVLNVRKAMDLGEECLQHGMIPFIPHLTMLQHLVHPHPGQDWLDYDIEWLKVCDCLLRFPGESAGADKEVELAKILDLPVFTSVYDLVDFKNSKIPQVLFNVTIGPNYDDKRTSR